MNPTELRLKNQYIVYDRDLLSDSVFDVAVSDYSQSAEPSLSSSVSSPIFQLFDVASLQDQNRIVGQAVGRGNTYFVNLDVCQGVLRQYLRGGMVAKLTADRYLWRNLYATRAWREWFLLGKLRDFDLNVPRPVAAHVLRFGLTYSANILVERIMDASPLSALLTHAELTDELWRKIGSTIRRFHQRGVYHSDLNAHNILITGQDEVYLIDFDKCYLRQTKRSWQLENLNRLYRSLNKLRELEPQFRFSANNWSQLESAYTQR